MIAPDPHPAEALQRDPHPAARPLRLVWIAAGAAVTAAGIAAAAYWLGQRHRDPRRFIVGNQPPELFIPERQQRIGRVARAWHRVCRFVMQRGKA